MRMQNRQIRFVDDYRDATLSLGAAPYWQGAAARRFDASVISDSMAFFAAPAGKFTTAFPVDGVGDLKPPIVNGLITDPDEAGGGKDVPPGNPVITVGAPSIIASINTIGDEDFFQVTLTAGTTYEIGQYAYFGNGTHLTDPYIELYRADGTTLIVSADGGANTTYNDVNSGFDVLLTYTADVTGTYYINARAFSNSPATNNGDSVGDYELFVRVQDPNDPNVYHPYYVPAEPLYAIDWGTQVNKVNQSVRNPDGNEGTRTTGSSEVDPTGNPPGTVPATNPNLASGKNVITIYFAQAGDIFVSNDPTKPGLPPATITAVGVQQFEHDAVITALAEFAKVADIIYVEVDTQAEADFIYTSYQGTPGPGVSLLGSMSPPDESDEGLAQFNSGDERWNARDLAQGGFSFVTLIHEFGHGHGLAHPHDNGGHSGIMNGVEEESPFNYTTGDYELNQGVFTMMSYEDGWQSSPYGNAPTNVGYGYLGGLSAFDIAAIQDKYGVNENYNTADNIYTMKDVNAPGTYFTCIWDGGGTDKIVYSGARDTTIDLRSASLKYEFGGGGWVSYAFGIYGGFTIANGVTIENATSGSGKDSLVGNAANNILDSGAGNDMLNLSAGGVDTALAGDGDDSIYYGAALTAADSNDGGAGARDVLILQGNYTLTFGAASLGNIEYLSLQSATRTAFGYTGGGSFDYVLTMLNANVGAGQLLTVNAQSLLAGEDFRFDGSAETDGKFLVFAGRGTDTLKGGAGADVFFFEGPRLNPGDTVDGGDGRDAVIVTGGTGVNHIEFGETNFVNIESISVTPRYASDASAVPSYELVLKNGNVTAGGSLIVNGSSLGATQTFNVNGSAVSGGSLNMFGGAADDVFVGGGMADTIFAAGGGDTSTGGGGADIFQYRSASDSVAADADRILDFEVGVDKIDLHFMDADSNSAGDQAFSFIGSGAFTNSAGQLRATFDSGNNVWNVEGDTNGDGAADFLILVTATTAAPLTGTDFVL
jgi:serralysin